MLLCYQASHSSKFLPKKIKISHMWKIFKRKVFEVVQISTVCDILFRKQWKKYNTLIFRVKMNAVVRLTWRCKEIYNFFQVYFKSLLTYQNSFTKWCLLSSIEITVMPFLEQFSTKMTFLSIAGLPVWDYFRCIHIFIFYIQIFITTPKRSLFMISFIV